MARNLVDNVRQQEAHQAHVCSAPGCYTAILKGEQYVRVATTPEEVEPDAVNGFVRARRVPVFKYHVDCWEALPIVTASEG